MMLVKIGFALLWLVQSASSKPGIDILGFDLDETTSDIVSKMGQPDDVDGSLPNYVSWLFKHGARDEHDYGYLFCFRRSDHKLVSVTRNFEPEALVDHLFPKGSFVIRQWPSDENPQFGARVRKLSGDRLLLGMGCTELNKPCGQIILIDRTVLPIFFPWLSPPSI